MVWTRSRLDDRQKIFLANLPLTVEEGDRLFVHASACAPDTWIYILGAREAEQSLMATNRRLTFCGHTHFPALFHATAMTPAQRHLPVEGRPTPLLAQRSGTACWEADYEAAGIATNEGVRLRARPE